MILSSSMRSLAIMALRTASLCAKFLFALYLARFVGLPELGTFGLTAGAAVVVPLAMGLGLCSSIARDAVGGSRAALCNDLLRYWGLLGFVYAAVALALATSGVLAGTVPLMAAAIVLLEHLNQDVFVVLTNLRRAVLANSLLFLRAGMWMGVAMALGIAVEGARALGVALALWVAGDVLALLVFAGVARDWPWHAAIGKGVRAGWYADRLRLSWRLYVAEACYSTALYVDRYLVGLWLGLEAAGVYVLFWQVGNAVYNLANTGVMQLYRPLLVRAADARAEHEFLKLFAACLRKALGAAIGLSALAGAGTWVALPYLGQPTVIGFEPLLSIVLGMLVVRVAADVYGYRYYAARHDGELLLTNALMLATTTVTVAGAADMGLGLYGVATATMLASVVTLAVRMRYAPLPGR